MIAPDATFPFRVAPIALLLKESVASPRFPSVIFPIVFPVHISLVIGGE
jgi:hypothetical protein